jgi:amino acid adenylation domain-containing protein
MDDNSARTGGRLESKFELAQRLLRKKGIHIPQRQSIPSRTEPGPAPLSFGQEGLWLLNQLDPDSPFYNIASAVRLTGQLNLIALKQSLNEIIRRHDVLRTIFPTTGGEPMQEALPNFNLPLSLVNLQDLSESERHAELRRLAAEEARRVFDLAQGPLVRATLLSLSEQEHVFLLTRHHIIFDGWSLGVFVRELVAIYEAFSNGEPSPLPELPLQFADFAAWQRQWLKGENLERQLSHWRQQLSDIPALDLPLDKPRPPVQSFRGASQTLLLSKDLSGALNALSLANNWTLFMTLLAAFKVLLYKYTGQDDVAIGTRIAGRNTVETRNLIGYFVNALVLRTDLSGDPTFVECTERVSSMLLDAYAYQDMPFEKLVELLTPERDPSRQPYFNVTFALQNAPLPTIKLKSLTLQLLRGASETSKHDLDISITEEANGMSVLVEYNTDLFDPDTITRLIEHYRTLLQSIALNPHAHLSELSPLALSEKHQLLVEWNDTQSAYPERRTLAELFEAQAERTPDRVAYIYEDQYLSYGELNRRSNQLAHYLRWQGVGPEIPVAVCLKRSLESMVALMAIVKAGGAYVPVDVTHPVSEQEYIIAEAQVKVVIAEEGWTERVRVNGVRVVCLEKEWKEVSEEPAVNAERAGGAENISHIMYTSGSSGEPKGVVVEQRQLLNRFEWMWGAYPFATHEVACQNTNIGFVVSLWEMLGPLLKGVPTVIAPDIVVKDQLRFVEILAEHGVSRIVMVPSLLQALLDSGADLQRRLPSLKLWTTCGEPLSLELYRRFRERAAYARLVNQYGASEVHDATYYNTEPQSDYLSSMPIGRPINNIQVYLLDGALQPVPVGVPGEIHIGSVGLARGYLNRPDLTAEKFIPNPISGASGARLYKTGDLARQLADGRIECLGRRDHQVKIRGMRVELKQIEAVLGRHPAVGRSVVLARKTDDRPGEKRLVAYVVPKPGTQPTVAELQGHLKQNLPEHMLPSAYVLLDSLPLTPSGKVNRLALPAPAQARPRTEAVTPPAPQSEIERTIANIWKEVLKLESVGLDAHFFDLGGHSLMMGQVRSKLQEAIGRDVPMVDLFRYTTISELANHLSSKTEDVSPAPSGRIALTGGTVRKQRGSDIAIVGMAGRFPGAKNIADFWRNLRNGVESSSFLSDDDLKAAGMNPAWFDQPGFVRRKPVLEEVELFDASFFGFTPREAEIMDPQHRFFLECAWEALESAGYAAESYERPVGVYAGTSMSSYLLFNLFPNYRFNESGDSFQAVIANDKDYLATVVSYKLNLKGPSLTVQTACSTSLVAIYLACQGLLEGDCDMALAGGVSISVPQKAGYFYQPEGTSSPDGHCRAFDAKAQGTVFGSGAGVVVLKRLEDALADGDRIEAIIKGAAINNDGSLKVGYIAPSIDGQRKVIARALEKAGVSPETISYVETHGVATPLGDPIEIAALTEAFQQHTRRKGFCAIGSVKTNIGHLNAAAGVASLIKTVLMLKHKTIPPSLNFEEPNPRIDFINSPFFVNTELTEWKAALSPRRAGISSFGVGGTNAHVILEEAPPVDSADSSSPWQLLLLSARTNAALERSTDELADHLRQHPNESLADIAYTLQVGRRRFNHRRMLVCVDREDALRTLDSRDPRRIWNSIQESKDRPVAFMFPGLGDQYVDMASDLYRHEPLFREQVDYCCERLKSHLSDDLRDVCYPARSRAVEERREPGIPPAHSQLINLREMLNPTQRNNDEAARKLNRTIYAQPALFVIEYALARLLMEWGIRPQAMIGHSLGEYTAACLAEVMSLDDALLLVAGRARMMEQLPPGAMLAVPLSEDELRPLLGEDLWLAAINGPSLCVAAGGEEAVTRLQQQLLENGLAARRLQTTHAFHSGMMKAIVEPFTQLVRSIKLNAPRIPYVSNVTGSFITAAEATDPGYWAEHMCGPVRFSEGLDALWRKSDKLLLEVGPGQTLCSFARQHPENGPERIVLASLRHPYEQQSDRAFMLNTLGSLWMAGVRIDWSAFHLNERRRRVTLPSYPFERRRYWIEPQPQTSSTQAQLIPEDKKQERTAQQLYIPIWKQSLLPVEDEHGTPTSQRWLVFVDEAGVGSRIVERLEQAGHDVITVMAGKQFGRLSDRKLYINPSQREDYDALLEELKALDQIPQKIAHLWSVGPVHFSSSGLSSFEALQKEGFYSLLFLMQALKSYSLAEPLDIAVISSNMQAVIERQGMTPTKAPILGLCKVIPHEYDNVTCRSIDIAIRDAELWRSENLIERLVKEITGKSSDSPVAYSEDHRWIQKFEPVSLNGSSERMTRLREGGVYLITNGLEGIGFELAQYLACNVRAKLVLVDHTPAVDDAEPVSMYGSEDRSSSSRLSAATARVNIELEEQADSITQLEEKAERELNIKGPKDYQGVEEIANRLCTSYLCGYLESGNVGLIRGKIYSREELREKLGILPRFGKLYDLIIKFLSEDEILKVEGDTIEILKAKEDIPDQRKLKDEFVRKYPEFSSLLNLLEHCVSNYPKALSGEIEAISVLYPEGRSDLIENFYSSMENYRHDRVYQTILKELVAGILRGSPQKTIRILEVGGGNGILTESLLPTLKGRNVEYYFTDIGKVFALAAEKRAVKAGLNFMKFGVLDISRDPVEQGYKEHSFDLILGFDVVHATRSIEETLGNLKKLLAPNGLLGLIEAASVHRWSSMMWGLIPGWWSFEDVDLRTDSPLLSPAKWEEVVRKQDFKSVKVYPQDEQKRADATYGFILAQQQSEPLARRASEQTLTFSEEERLPADKMRRISELENAGASVLAFSADITRINQMQSVVTKAFGQFGKVDAVIHAADSSDGCDIQHQTPEMIDRELMPPVSGAMILDTLFKDVKLDFFALVSTVSPVSAGRGRMADSAASAFLDAFAQSRRPVEGMFTVSVNWDAPRDGHPIAKDVAMTEPTQLQAMNIEETAHSNGELSSNLSSFSRLLAITYPQVIVSSQDPEARREVKTDSVTGVWPQQPGEAPAYEPSHPRPLLAKDYVAPRNEIERKVAAIWQALLGIEQLGVHDNFIELGGDSLIAVQMLSRLKNIFSVEISLRALFEAPTIAELALVVVMQQAQQSNQESLLQMLSELEQLPEGAAKPDGLF